MKPSLPIPTPSSWDPLVCFPSLWICLFWTFPEWNPTVHGLLGLASLAQHALQDHPCGGVCHVCLPFYNQLIVRCVGRPQFVNDMSVDGPAVPTLQEQ